MPQVIDFKNGFAVDGKSGRTEYQDEQVVGLSLYQKRVFLEGSLSGHKRYFLIWVEGEEKPIKCVDFVEIETADELDPLIKRLSQNYSKRSAVALDAGAVVDGDGFVLDKTSLTIGKAGKQVVIPTAELAFVEEVDDQLKVWRVGQDEPVSALPFSKKNTCVL